MSIATLKVELERELTVVALGGETGHRPPMGAGTDLIDWMSGPPNLLLRAWVYRDRGPALIFRHVRHGSRVWFAPGSAADHYVGGPREIVVTNVVYRTNDPEGVSRIHVKWNNGLAALFATEGAVDGFLENVLNGHVQDA